jgi:hypothetical protein
MMNEQHSGWTRLQDTLTALKPGDTVALDALVAETGLPRDVVQTVLVELARIDLFVQHDDTTFKRRSLWAESG